MPSARRGSASEQHRPGRAAWLADPQREKPVLLDVRERWEWRPRASLARSTSQCVRCPAGSKSWSETGTWWQSATTAAAACRWRCFSRRTALQECITCRGASMPGRVRSIRPFLLLASSSPAARRGRSRADLPEAQRSDPVFTAARHTLEAGRERLPQGRALLLPTLNLSGSATQPNRHRVPRCCSAEYHPPRIKSATRSASISRSSACRT